MALDFGLLNSGLFPSSEAEGLGMGIDEGARQLIDGGKSGEGNLLIWPWFYKSIGQGTWAQTGSTSVFGVAGVWGNDVGVNGDNITYGAYLSAGTYEFSFFGQKTTSMGKIDVFLDEIQIASQYDCYNAGDVRDTRYIVTPSFTLSEARVWNLRIQLNGKNPASASYIFRNSFLLIRRIAE